MKKFFALLTVIACLLAMVACTPKEDPKPVYGNTLADFVTVLTQGVAPQKAVIETRVETTLGTLNGRYTITYTGTDAATIAYSYEEFNPNPLEGELKNVFTGTISYGNGEYSGSVSGAVSVPTELHLTLAAETLQNLSIEGSALRATVLAADTKAVFGTAFSSDVALTLVKTEYAIGSMTFSYVDGADTVTVSCGYN